MSRTKERTPQLKTLERMVISGLKNKSECYDQLRLAYKLVYEHFADENFLHGFHHCQLLQAIYVKNYYKYNNMVAMCEEFFMDVKTLIDYRKDYLCLIAKHYLHLTDNTEDFRSLLFSALQSPENTPNS